MACPPPQFGWLSWATWSCLREDIVPVATFIGAAIIAWAALAQAKTARQRHEAQTEADRERRTTESFAKAIEQLGSDKLEIRLGGIYTLERIARESEREYWPIMETLTAFVRERAPWPPRQALANPFAQLQGVGHIAGESTRAEPEKTSVQVRPATDIAAVLTVLGRRTEEQRMQDKARLDLSRTDLRGAYLGGAHLERADLGRAHLEGANLTHLEGAWLTAAHLQGADLSGARLKGANFARAGLQGAILTAARLEHANLRGAHLDGADFFGAHIGGAHIQGTNLQGARNLTQEQLDAANGDDRTWLPDNLVRPAHWSKSEGRDSEPQQ